MTLILVGEVEDLPTPTQKWAEGLAKHLGGLLVKCKVVPVSRDDVYGHWSSWLKFPPNMGSVLDMRAISIEIKQPTPRPAVER